jgi:glycosyltransferase involved in cell wall biosynthesis
MTRILHSIADAQYGGAQWYLLELIREQRSRGNTVTLVSGAEGPLVDEYASTPDRFIHLPSLRRSVGPWDVAAARQLVKLAGDHDLVHVHASKALYVSQLSMKPLKVVWSAHGYDSAHADFRLSARPVLGWTKAFLARRAAAISAASLSVAGKLARAGVRPERVRVVYTGVRTERFGSVPDVAPRSPVVVGAAGRFVRIKGFDVLIGAAAEVIAKGVAARFVLYGSGDEEPALRAAIRNNNLEGTFEIFQPTTDFPRALEGMDIVAVPSLVDSFPLVPCEAMVAGRPIIASRVGGIPEAFNDREQGFLVEPGDVSGLAQAIITLARDPHRIRLMGRSARRYASERYRWSAVADAYEELYRIAKS